ncbi:ABC transporter permease subunit [Ruminococcus flavefaciens]|uniref:ABC transporter permease subunit n=1 Tax=Ruminococcus flavefaciens TaxID=1265 RepID=UPI0026F1DFD2|nr:sugar ABC transporter permease [Ruminococcus flavefaciens]MDD7516483.1 sugar ABC transporter permease [Ruminococcus flavefaciens]MDY5690757.1 sugar ABC transporter permease [Ruminococcus flavefaciens]
MNVKTFIKKYTMVIALVVVFIFFAVWTENRLLLPQNLSNLLLQNAYVLVMACGMLLCILTGGNIDLSVGSTVCLVGAIAAQLMAKHDTNAYLVIIICLVLSCLIGMWQGFWIGYVHIPPFICTLAGMFLFRGIGRAILESKTVAISSVDGSNGKKFLDIFASYIEVPGLDGDVKWSAFVAGIVIAAALLVITAFNRIKKAKKGYKQASIISQFGKIIVIDALVLAYTWKLAHYKGIPVMALWVLAVVFIYAFITSKTAFGRYFYAVGGNEKATKLSGINTNKVYFMAYTSMSLLAGLSGLLIAARIGSINGDTGNSFEMDAIGSCFIGGASAYGGSGTVGGVMVGAILLGVINQGMSIKGLDNNWQYVVKGAVLLIAVIFDVVSNKKTGKAG